MAIDVGRMVCTMSVRCEACDGSVTVSSPVSWDGLALRVADLLGSEQVYLRLFAETHIGPFVASAEA